MTLIAATSCEHYVRLQLRCEGDGLRSIARFADHFDIFFGPENHPEAVTDERLVVGEQDADQAFTA
jgi:hypothetical protein